MTQKELIIDFLVHKELSGKARNLEIINEENNDICKLIYNNSICLCIINRANKSLTINCTKYDTTIMKLQDIIAKTLWLYQPKYKIYYDYDMSAKPCK